MTDYKKLKVIQEASAGKTIKGMEISSSGVELLFTDGSSLDIEFYHDEAYGFSVEVEEKE